MQYILYMRKPRFISKGYALLYQTMLHNRELFELVNLTGERRGFLSRIRVEFTYYIYQNELHAIESSPNKRLDEMLGDIIYTINFFIISPNDVPIVKILRMQRILLACQCTNLYYRLSIRHLFSLFNS